MHLAYAVGICGQDTHAEVRAGKRAPSRIGYMHMAGLALK